MIIYKNISCSAKTFYGVKFEPGEIKEVPGYITCSSMVRVFGVKPVPKQKEIIAEPRGKKKKINEPEKDFVAEKQEIKTEISEEETTNGNPS